MHPYNVFKAVMSWIALIVMALGAFTLCGTQIASELSRRAALRKQFGAGWQSEYESTFGPLIVGDRKITVAIIAMVAIVAVTIWLYRVLREQFNPGTRKRAAPQKRVSYREQKVRFKRNALLGIYFGGPIIIFGVALNLFDWGLFSEHSSEEALGIFVFLFGYVSVVVGCGWWLKAKGWTEAIGAIGFLPLVVLFIPFVRLIFVAAPILVPAGMILLAAILVVVVLVLPDRSPS